MVLPVLFVGIEPRRLHLLQLADVEVLAILGHQRAHHADNIAPAHKPCLVCQLLPVPDADGQAEAGVDVPGAVEIPPREAQLHLAVGVIALRTVDIFVFHLLEGAGHQLAVRHGEIHRAVQTAEALLPLVLAADDQKQDDHGEHHAVQSVSLHDAPGKGGDGSDEGHAIDGVLSAPEIFQSVHRHSPFLNSPILPHRGGVCKGKSHRNPYFPLAFAGFSAIITPDIDRRTYCRS